VSLSVGHRKLCGKRTALRSAKGFAKAVIARLAARIEAGELSVSVVTFATTAELVYDDDGAGVDSAVAAIQGVHLEDFVAVDSHASNMHAGFAHAREALTRRNAARPGLSHAVVLSDGDVTSDELSTPVPEAKSLQLLRDELGSDIIWSQKRRIIQSAGSGNATATAQQGPGPTCTGHTCTTRWIVETDSCGAPHPDNAVFQFVPTDAVLNRGLALEAKVGEDSPSVVALANAVDLTAACVGAIKPAPAPNSEAGGRRRRRRGRGVGRSAHDGTRACVGVGGQPRESRPGKSARPPQRLRPPPPPPSSR